jgi:hypothetical protein
MSKRPTNIKSRKLITGALVAWALAFQTDGAAAAETIPDLSGIWGHLTLPPFEPPLAGPGPVRNLSRVSNQFCAQPPCGANASASPNGVSNIYQLVGDYTNPILKPEAAEIVKQHGLISLTGAPYPTPSNQCRPNGVPYVFWNIGMQMLQEPNKVTLLYSNDHEVRHVRLNAQHPEKVTPSWYGDSVGHYEGDTLVIDTIGFKNGPHSMVDLYGTPFSEALHVVERYRLIDYEAAQAAEARPEKDGVDFNTSDPGFQRDPGYKGKALQLEFIIEDGGVFTTSWSATITYRRPTSPLGGWPEYVCAENPYGYFPGGRADIPVADKPDF